MTARRISIRFILMPAAAMWLLFACSMPGASQRPARQTYVLQGEPDRQLSATGVSWPCITLRISMPDAAPGFTTAKMAYAHDTQRIEYFAYNQWIDTPARMIGSMMNIRLERNDLFGAVISGSSDIRADHRMDSEVQRLLQVVTAGGSEVFLAVKVNLIDVENRLLLNSKTFEYVEPASKASPAAGVAAANRAAERFLGDLARFLAESIDSGGCGQSNRG